MGAVERLVIRADGAARGNPGPAAAGAVLIDASADGAHRPDAPPVAVIARPLGIQTNNYAEYTAVLLALERAAELGAREVDLVLDSKLVVEQLAGRWKVRHPALAGLNAEARRLLGGFRRWTARHEPRAANAAADALANLALDDPAAAAAAEGSAQWSAFATSGLRAADDGRAADRPVTAGRGGAQPEPVGHAAVGAAVAIFDAAGRVLLVRHTYAGRKWGLPGGHTLPGEPPNVTARRELAEETGLAVEATDVAGVYFDAHDSRFGASLHFVFRAAWSGEAFGVRSPEIDEVAFWSPADLPSPTSEFTRRRIRDAGAPGATFSVLRPGERE